MNSPSHEDFIKNTFKPYPQNNCFTSYKDHQGASIEEILKSFSIINIPRRRLVTRNHITKRHTLEHEDDVEIYHTM